MSYETVEWQQDGGIGRITLNRPETVNAWNAQFADDMKALLGQGRLVIEDDELELLEVPA